MPDYFGAEEKACWKFIVSAVPAGLLDESRHAVRRAGERRLGDVSRDVASDRQHRASGRDGRRAAAESVADHSPAGKRGSRAGHGGPGAFAARTNKARRGRAGGRRSDGDPACVLGEPRGSRSAALATGARHSMPCLPVPRPISLSHRPSLVRPHLVVKAPLVRWHGLEADRVANALQRAVLVPPVEPCLQGPWIAVRLELGKWRSGTEGVQKAGDHGSVVGAGRPPRDRGRTGSILCQSSSVKVQGLRVMAWSSSP